MRDKWGSAAKKMDYSSSPGSYLQPSERHQLLEVFGSCLRLVLYFCDISEVRNAGAGLRSALELCELPGRVGTLTALPQNLVPEFRRTRTRLRWINSRQHFGVTIKPSML